MPSPFSTTNQQIRGKANDSEIRENGFLCPRISMFDKIKKPRLDQSPSNCKIDKNANKLNITNVNFAALALKLSFTSVVFIAMKKTEMSKHDPYTYGSVLELNRSCSLHGSS